MRAYSNKVLGKDISKNADIVFGAAPLITEEFKSGRLDACLNFWTYAARLAGSGSRQLLSMAEVINALDKASGCHSRRIRNLTWQYVERERLVLVRLPQFQRFQGPLIGLLVAAVHLQFFRHPRLFVLTPGFGPIGTIINQNFFALLNVPGRNELQDNRRNAVRDPVVDRDVV